VEDIINLLCKTFGFNKYEAEAYVSLLKKPNTSAYEISKDSGVPQSKIYGTMKALLTKKVVLCNEGKVTKYTALPFEVFLADFEETVSNNGKKAKQYFEQENLSSANEYVLHIEKEEDVFTKIIALIKSCKRTLEIEIWAELYDKLYRYLADAEKRGVELRLVLYGTPGKKLGTMFYHEMGGMDKATKLSGQWLTLIADNKETLFVIKQDGHYNSCIWTRNESVMMLSKSFIGHDILMAEIYNEFRDQLDEKFGKNLIQLREKYDIF